MDYPSQSAVVRGPASKSWFVAAKFFLWLASFDFASFFLGFIFMWPFKGPDNPNYLLIAAVLIVVIGIIFVIYRAFVSGLQQNSGLAKSVTAILLALSSLAFLYPCLSIALTPVMTLFTRH